MGGFAENMVLGGYWGRRRSSRGSGSGAASQGPFDIEITDESIIARYNRGKNTEVLAQFNSEIEGFGSNLRESLIQSINSAGIKGKNLIASLRTNTYKRKDTKEIFKIGYSFLPEGVYVHLGVGRGYHSSGGIVTKDNEGSWNRKPKPWFNPVVSSHIPMLEEIIGRYIDGATINTIRIYIGKNM